MGSMKSSWHIQDIKSRYTLVSTIKSINKTNSSRMSILSIKSDIYIIFELIFIVTSF